MTVAEQFPTIGTIIEAARKNLSPDLWDYLSGGAESEVTLRRNRAAFDRIAFKPRRMCDVRHRNIRRSFLGCELRLPVMLAPVGSIARYHPDGALACARVAERVGTVTFVSCMASPSIEEVRAGTNGPLVSQLYVLGDRAWIENEVRRAEAAGCVAICLTADVAARGHRERNLVNAFGGSRGAGTSDDLADLIRYGEALTWEDFDWLRDRTKLPLILKGVMCAEDARLAVEHGADVIHVSNHGGRQLDHLLGAIEVLPEVVAAVNGRAEVIVDSGFVRGSDVLKALALGANAVLIGKLMGWALAAAGEECLEHALGMLGDEMTELLAHLGVRGTHDLNAECLLPAVAPPESSWIGFALSGE